MYTRDETIAQEFLYSDFSLYTSIEHILYSWKRDSLKKDSFIDK